MTAGWVSTRVSGSEHTFYLPKVLDDNNLDFLQAHAGLHMLSLDIDEFKRIGRDFQVAAADCNQVLSGYMQMLRGALSTKCAGNQHAVSIPSCLQGLTHLTELTSLTISMCNATDSKPLISAIAKLTTLQHLSITPPNVKPSPLSALR